MNTRGFNSLTRKIEQIESRVKKSTRSAAASSMAETKDVAQQELLTGGQVVSGNLVTSLDVRPIENTDGFTYELHADAPYASFVEFGSGPRTTNTPHPLSYSGMSTVTQLQAPYFSENLVGAMFRWVQNKPGFFGERTYKVAWQIAATVGRNSPKAVSGRGTNPHPYMRPAYFVMWGTGNSSAGVSSIASAYKTAVQI